MKKILSLTAAVVAVFTCTPVETQAGEVFRSRIHSRCGHCSSNILAYFRPVRFLSTRPIYGWVPSYHGNCGSQGLRGAAAASNLRYSYGAANRHNYGYGAGPVRRTGRAWDIHRSLAGRTVSVYPGWRYSGLNRCR